MENKQFRLFLKYFVLCAGIIILMIFLLWKNELPFAFLNNLLGIIRPLIIGGVIAFILNKPMMKIQSLYIKIFNKKKILNKHGKEKNYKIVAILTVYILFIAVITGIIWFILPQLASSVKFFVDSFDSYYTNFNTFINTNFSNLDLSWLDNFDVKNKFYSWLSGLTENIPELIMTTFGITKNIISGAADIFIGLIFSLYVLGGKNKLKNQTGRVFRSLFSEQNYYKIVDFYNLTSNTFSNFINGQMTEACILGVLCFIGMTILGFQYSILISVIIGITNLLPIFGPIFGTVPCTLILLLVDPISAVWFMLYIVILQQIESNLIYPRVVGGSVGLAPVWTLTAIIIGGGLFGILGMLLAVPTMSIIYVSVGRLVNKKLKKKNEVDFISKEKI